MKKLKVQKCKCEAELIPEIVDAKPELAKRNTNLLMLNKETIIYRCVKCNKIQNIEESYPISDFLELCL